MTTRKPDIARRGAIGLLMLLALAACAPGDGVATRGADACLSDDWFAVGFADGSQATGTDRATQYQACEGFDETGWRSGYLDGLRGYCTEARAYLEGRRGLNFPQGCRTFEAELTQAYAFGKTYWELDFAMWRQQRRMRDSTMMGQWTGRNAEYQRLRRERALYAQWPPVSGAQPSETALASVR